MSANSDNNGESADFSELRERIEALENEVRDTDGDESPTSSRRNFLKSAGIMGAGALLGGGAASEAVGTADAATPTGTIGSPSKPVNAYLEKLQQNLDANGNDITNVGALNADELSGKYAGKVRAIASGEVIASIDPSATTTPVQDALDAIDAATPGTNKTYGDGTVILPPGHITEASPWRSVGGKQVYGQGLTSTTVEFTDLDSPAWDVQEFEDACNSYVTGFTIDGSDRTNRTAPLIHYSGGDTPHACHVGRLRLINATDPVVHFENSHPYSSHWEYIRGADYDGGLLLADNLAKMFSIGEIYGSPINPPTNDDTGLVSIANTSGTVIDIRKINAGGANVRALDANVKANGTVNVGVINFEPSSGGSHNAAVRLLNSGGTTIGGLSVANVSDIDQFVELRGAGRKHIGHLVKPGGVTVNNNYICALSDTNGPITYLGESGDVDNDSGGTLTHPISCLGDLTTVS